MIIANPIYDVVFKRLMENERVVKFFIGTLLGQTIESVEANPRDFIYFDEGKKDFVSRFYFMVVIKTENGEREKILIEIQKARKPVELVLYRDYLHECGRIIEENIDCKKTLLPIITIYILGFNLSGIETACIKGEENYKDLINKTVITGKSHFVESLTHGIFVIQTGRITDRYQTRLDKLLSVFEQAHFIDDKRVVKQYAHEPDEEEVRLITDILHHSGTEPEERKLIEIEQEAWRSINAMFADYIEKEEKYIKTIEAKDKEIEALKHLLNKK